MSDLDSLNICIVDSLSEVDSVAWNRLNHHDSPFLSYEFLIALECHEAVGERFGWLPKFILAYDQSARLVGAMPLYKKDNSYGELVFDWAWADAFHRHGVHYYPKLVSAIPYTPVTGERLLTLNNDAGVRRRLIDEALSFCKQTSCSSLHCLFPVPKQADELASSGLHRRFDVQYHWFNQDYQSFDDFLSGLKNTKRKKIKQERRRIRDKGISLSVLSGHELSVSQWQDVHRFYSNTFSEKSGYATFSESFFTEIGRTMGDNIVVVMASLKGRNIAAAINYRDSRVLYGRHWGCDIDIPGLHFEVCYYQGIEYAIEHGLARFEPGAQGEYKMSRGFMPVLTQSSHWIEHEEFRAVINEFMVRESRGVKDYYQTLMEHAPYKRDHPVYDHIQS